MRNKRVQETNEWTNQAVRDLIRSDCSLLSGLSDGTVDAVVAAGRIVAWPEGTLIATRDERRAEATLILRGTLRSYSVSPDGREYRISVQEAGDLHGVLSCLDGGDSPHDAVADKDLVVFVVGVADFRRLMADYPDFRDAIVALLCLRLRQSFAMIDTFAIGSPKERLAGRLLELAAQHGRETSDGTVIGVQVTQDSLGAMIGLSRQRTNLHLKALEREGLIRLKGGRVVIVDPDGLSDVAG